MKPSSIVTLTTDFGLHDPYVLMMKGVILSINPDVHLIDITHDISSGSIIQAAGIIKDAVPYFPNGTVNVAVVDPGVGSERLPVAIETEDSFFVGPDNGIFWMAIEKRNAARVIHLTGSRQVKFASVPRGCTGDEGRSLGAGLSEGEPLALYGSSGFLEIAVNNGRVADLLGVRTHEIIGMEVFITRDK